MRIIKQEEIPSLLWLAKRARLDDRVLGNILTLVRNGDLPYTVVQVPKSDGGTRELSIPDPHLRSVQRSLNKNVLSEFSGHHSTYGFSSGSIVNAITPHLESKVVLSFDVMNAFGQISKGDVIRGLTAGRTIWYGRGRRGVQYDFGLLSWNVANIVADISTWNDILPQGAPTSPRLFDQAFKVIDAGLSKYAAKLNGVFTRYADNIFFSLKEKTYFPPRLERAVLRVVGRKYSWHKRSVRRMDKGVVRMLGLNIMERKISVPRSYKRRLRLAQHHIRYLLGHDLSFEEEWLRLKGQMNFGRLGVLPDSLVKGYATLESEIEEM